MKDLLTREVHELTLVKPSKFGAKMMVWVSVQNTETLTCSHPPWVKWWPDYGSFPSKMVNF